MGEPGIDVDGGPEGTVSGSGWNGRGSGDGARTVSGEAPPQRGPQPDPGEWRGSWYLPAETRRAAFPWAGISLVLVGAALLLHQLEPRLDGGSLAAIAFALAFLGAWRFGASRLALWPGAVLLGYGVGGLLAGLGVLPGDGWGTVGVGAGLALAWLLSGVRGRPGHWLLAIAAVFVLVGLAEVVAQWPPFGGLDQYVAPALIIAIGLLVLARNRTWSRGA